MTGGAYYSSKVDNDLCVEGGRHEDRRKEETDQFSKVHAQKMQMDGAQRDNDTSDSPD